MTELFFKILEISITSGIVAVVVMFLRLVFKGAPRWISCMLWALVALRLMCPFAVESEFSLMPELPYSQEIQLPENRYASLAKPLTQTESNTHQGITDGTVQEKSESVDVSTMLTIVWLCGMGVMALYGGVSYSLTRRRVKESIPLKDNIRLSESVSSPFILGVISPHIYLPFTLNKRTQKYVLAHEQAHLRRLDHIWKPLGFVLLCVHWFNPLMWVSYVLLCRDIEVACDERVIRDYSLNKRKDYARALLDCKVSQKTLVVCPLAFGEVGVGERIKKTLRYKKTATAIVATAVVITLLLSVGLLTDPVSSAQVEFYTSDTRVTAGYEKFPESVTEPLTEDSEELATEAPAQTDIYDVTDYDYSEDYNSYDEIYEKLPLVLVEHHTEIAEDYITDSEISSDKNYGYNDFFDNNNYGGIDPNEPIEVFPSPESSYDSPFGDRSTGVEYTWIVP